jgi:hypothetical protein
VELVEENLLISVAHGSEPMFAEDLAVKLNPSDFINFIMTKTREESESS